jgi:hypothetical protein
MDALGSDMDLEEAVEALVLNGRCPAIDSLDEVDSEPDVPVWSATAMMIAPGEPGAINDAAVRLLTEPWRLGKHVVAVVPESFPDPAAPEYKILELRPNRLRAVELEEILQAIPESAPCPT